MQDYLISMALSILFTVLKGVSKNPQSKAQMRAACMKLYKAIRLVYADDPEF